MTIPVVMETPTTTVAKELAASHWSACSVAVLLALALIYQLRQVRGTTLCAPCIWALISTASLGIDAVVDSLARNSDSGIGLSALRLAAVATTFCPLMAVLGAKRPQDRGWQWVVLTLWIVIVWPAAQAVLTPTGLRVELFIVWKLFLAGLVAVGLLNYLPTRNWPSACFFAAGQVVLLDNYLWRWAVVAPQWALAVGLGCFLVAAVIASTRHLKKAATAEMKSRSELADLDQRWLEFRDAYGALWALRILARVNQTAELRDWPMRLTWSGLTPLEVEGKTLPGPEQLEELRLAMATVLRRFV